MLEKYLQRNDSTAYRTIAGAAMIVGAPEGKLCTLNQVSTLLWEMADGKHTLAEIVERICEKFDVEYPQAVKDAEIFVQELVSKNMLMLTDSPASSKESQ